VTREQLEAKLATDPRFKLVRKPGTGIVIVAGSGGAHLVEPRQGEFSLPIARR
jgi:hypothetical protein